MVVLLIAAIALGVWQLFMLAHALIIVSQGRSVTVGVLPGILSAVLFALFFLL